MRKKIDEYNFPNDLKTMTLKELEHLCVEIREFLIEKVSKTGGHLASNLGAVELTVALHYFFDAPKDKIIWDVGHQSYVHKILTGRAKDFDTLRKFGGLSGFPKTSESEYDTFDTGHSSNSISLAASFAAARNMKGEDNEVVSIIGDGSLTGGLAYEGLNNLGGMKLKSIVILNDNGMSIDKNTGGISKHLGKVRVSKSYYEFKKGLQGTLEKIPGVGTQLCSSISKLKDSIKFSIVDGIMFEKLGFTYLGPIDGHDLDELLYNMTLAKAADGPVIMHIITQKGRGYINAEKNPSKFHGISRFDVATGELLKKSNKISYSRVFGNKIVEIARKNDKIVAVSAAMIDGTGLGKFAKVYKERMFDVGIAEGHAVTFAAGLAKNGYIPFVAIYSTFLQRAYDEIVIDVCLQNLPVIFAIDRAGVVGEDGETHHGLFDITYLKAIPNLVILAPRDGNELEAMMEYAVSLNCPVAIRYPRGDSGNMEIPVLDLEMGAEVIKEGSDVEIWAAGSMTKTAYMCAEMLNDKGISAGVVNARFIQPIDKNRLIESAKRTKYIVTLEDGILEGGFGETVNKIICETKSDVEVVNLGWPKQFIEHGSTRELVAKYKLDKVGVTERICDLLER
ncbi:MAG: 1-deoxy-D-xylulose-5-phosphate synthase [Anaerovoracaceae bacterium]